MQIANERITEGRNAHEKDNSFYYLGSIFTNKKYIHEEMTEYLMTEDYNKWGIYIHIMNIVYLTAELENADKLKIENEKKK